MSTSTETFQVSPEGAELYEKQFVPAIFAEWAPRIVEFAEVASGQRVLDVACGTGIVTRTATEVVGSSGSVVGVDLNPAMLDVARRLRPEIEWKQGDAADLPFPDEAFDTVLCQMALMFFPDRPKALTEMARVARGTVAVLVPSSIDAQPAYGPLVEVAVEHAGPQAASILNSYWSCGDLDELTALVASAGLKDVETKTVMGTASFPSADALVETEVEGSPLIDRITEETYAKIRESAREVLDPFTTPSGTLEAPLECHIVRGRKV